MGGPITPLVLGELRGDAPAGIVFIHAARHSPLHPNRGVGDHDDPRPTRSHDRWNRELDHHGGFPSLVGTAGDLGTYHRMGDRFEFLQLLRVGEHNGGQPPPIDHAVYDDHRPAFRHRGVRRPSRFEDLMTDPVCFDRLRSPGGKELSHRALARAEPTGNNDPAVTR